MTFGALQRKASPRYLSIFHGKKRSLHLWALIFLRFLPRAQIQPEIGQTLPFHSLGENRITSPTLLSGRDPRAPFQELFSFSPTRESSSEAVLQEGGMGEKEEVSECESCSVPSLKTNFAACNWWFVVVVVVVSAWSQNQWGDQVVSDPGPGTPTYPSPDYYVRSLCFHVRVFCPATFQTGAQSSQWQCMWDPRGQLISEIFDRHDVHSNEYIEGTIPSIIRVIGKINTVVPSYMQGMRSKTPSGCLKLSMVPNPKYTIFSFPMYTYLWSI